MFGKLKPSQPYFGLRGGWLTFWVTVACATDMMLFGYDQGVFGKSGASVCERVEPEEQCRIPCGWIVSSA